MSDSLAQVFKMRGVIVLSHMFQPGGVTELFGVLTPVTHLSERDLM